MRRSVDSIKNLATKNQKTLDLKTQNTAILTYLNEVNLKYKAKRIEVIIKMK